MYFQFANNFVQAKRCYIKTAQGIRPLSRLALTHSGEVKTAPLKSYTLSAGGVNFFGDGYGVAYFPLQNHLTDVTGKQLIVRNSGGSTAPSFNGQYAKFNDDVYGLCVDSDDNRINLGTQFSISWFAQYSAVGNVGNLDLYLFTPFGGSWGNALFRTPGESTEIQLAAVGIGQQLPDDDAFHHYCLVANGTTLRLYLDGTSVGTTPYSNSLELFCFAGGMPNLATTGNAYDAWPGNLCQIRLFNRVINNIEVNKLTNVGF